MAQESYKKLDEVDTSATKKRHCSTTYVQIACQLSLIILLIVCVVSIERRLAFLEKRIDSMKDEIKDARTKHEGGLEGNEAADFGNRLSRLTKQVRTLEYRTNGLSRNLHMKGTLPGDDDKTGNTGQQRNAVLKEEHRHDVQSRPSGVTYYRWGRTDCSGDATLVYHGYTASGHYKNRGSGSNYLCLTSNVTYAEHSYSTDSREGTTIFGAKYYTSFQGFKNNLNEHLAPCSLCYVESRGSQIMVPASNVCPVGWTMEYRGYLMSSHHQNHHSSQFVCVDQEAEAGGTAFADGAALHVVQGRCGALPCKLFVNGYQMTCVVCTM